jgi:hypothetical protein
MGVAVDAARVGLSICDRRKFLGHARNESNAVHQVALPIVVPAGAQLGMQSWYDIYGNLMLPPYANVTLYQTEESS